ncbi:MULTISPECIES: hemin uptake protein HemP [Inquilinus]|jgi:hemin uptake protein HemP|uniref:Hemin uptake protein HemP n=1 Tax=Inquilinus ginsengisoli TaxID=363840 RepID=A0ABU1JVX3_9PROT|nr:hemin uptake protein HemP [Inquilinus ginsengisoli]MDR6292761.1 hemin uptake protein HemP [Inquilinus ginsengisoli]
MTLNIEMFDQSPWMGPMLDQPTLHAIEPPQRPVATNLDTRELFGTRRELTIQHGEDVYRLRITRNSKLILTK